MICCTAVTMTCRIAGLNGGCASNGRSNSKPLIEESGGRFSDWSGTPSIHRPDVLISNGKLHDEALAILQTHSAGA
jgi:hypothetical protein